MCYFDVYLHFLTTSNLTGLYHHSLQRNLFKIRKTPHTKTPMSENRGILYKTRWEILLMASVLIISAVVVTAIPNGFTAKMLAEQKAQKQAEEEKNLETTLEEEVGFTEGTQGNMTGMNSSGISP